RRHLTAALRYSAHPPQRPSRLHLGCQTHQTYCFRTSSEPPRLPLVAWCTYQVQNLCRGLWGNGSNEQIFVVNQQNPGTGQSDQEAFGSGPAERNRPNSTFEPLCQLAKAVNGWGLSSTGHRLIPYAVAVFQGRIEESNLAPGYAA